MAEPVNPFTPTDLAKYKEFFKQPARPNVFGTPAGQQALETERAGLASFLGATDYGQQLEQSQDMGKLQLALALAQRGFAAAGATPKRGESSISTLSRELFSPLAGDAGAVASRMMQQRQALKAAERQEERQLKLAALQNVQGRQEKAFADDASATQQARNLVRNILKKGDTVSNDYLVGGKNIPLIQRKDHTGQIQGFFRLDGTKVNSAGVTIKPDATAAVKPITSWAKDVQVKGEDGKFRDAPGALRIADGTGKNSRVVLDNVTLDFDPKSKNYNARIVKKKSDQSAFYNPKSKSVFLSKPAIELYDLPKNLVGTMATYREYLVKPERRAANSQSIKELSVGGKTYVFNSHSGYDPRTGNITVKRGPDETPVTYEATQLFREEDPKAYVDVGDPLTVPSGSRLAEIRKIKGLSQITSGETLRFQRNAAGEERILYGKQTITLSPDESALFQVRDLSEVQQLDAGQTFRKFTRIGELIVPPGKTDLIPGSKVNEKVIIEKDQEGNVQYTYKGKRIAEDIALQLQASPLSEAEMRAAGLKDPLPDEPYVTYQNTGQITRILPDNREVGAGDTISLTATEYRNLAPEARDALRKTQPVDAAGVRRMVTTAFEHDGIEYFPGDWRTDNNAAFAALPPAIQQSLSDDSDLKKETLKKEHFKSFWKQIVEQQVNSGLMEKASSRAKPSEGDLSALLAQFPTGRRGVGTLRQAILNMIQLAPTAAEVSAGTAETEDLSYGDSIQRELNDAKKRYDTLLGKGIISGNQRWENLSFESQRAFANVARGRINVAKINNQWEKAQQKLTALRKDFEIPDANEVAAFNSSARLLILLKDLRDSNDLSKTGRFWEGFFSKLGAEVFGDFRPLTSAPSKRLLSIITDMQASLKTLSGTEGVDGRPSNFRLQLQQDLLPNFNRPEALNERNLNVIISKLENNIRGVFTPEIAGKYVIPRSFVRSAREAGLLKADVDPRRYPFVNPNEEGPPGVTRKGVLGAFGKHLYSLAEFEKLRVGRTLPADSRGRTLVKVSETEVQYALPNGMPDKKSPKFPAANMFQNAPVE